MEGTEFVLAIVIVGCVTSLIKTWINRKKDADAVDKETFNRLAQAFVQHKNDMRERVQNLEAIIAEEKNEKEEKEDLHYSQLEESQTNGSLTNDLKQKQRSR